MRLRFVLVGHPVAHSLSPAIFRSAFRALGLVHDYELLDCPDEAAVEALVDSLRRGSVAGANVTLPYKQLALELADDADPVARETGAANVLAPRAGKVVAFNTDVLALGSELASFAPGATQALILGSGGAALAAASACRGRGIRQLAVLARRFAATAPQETWHNSDLFAALGARLIPWPLGQPHSDSVLEDWAVSTDLVIQATSAGMAGGADGAAISEIVPWTRLPPSALAYDVVYTPAVTPFLERARGRGLAAVGGLGMLVAQAAHALSTWLDVEPPLSEMTRAAREALSKKEGGRR